LLTGPRAIFFLMTFALLWGVYAYASISLIVDWRLATVLVLLGGVLLAPPVWYLITLVKPHPISWNRPMSLTNALLMSNLLMSGLKQWRLTKAWLWTFVGIAALAMVTMFVIPQLRGAAFAVCLAEMPVMAALRRRSLGSRLYEFPRKHPALLTCVGGFVLAAGLVSEAACLLSPAYRNLAIFPAGVILFGYFLMHRAGRTILRERGIEWHDRMIDWTGVRGYEWCDDLKGRPSLRLKGPWGREDVWIPAGPVGTVDSVLVSHGIKPLYPAEPALV
jgi:hypothetical protein